jgi:hypothetical protein
MAAAGKVAQRLFALAVVLDFEIDELDAGFFLKRLGACVRGLVEAFIEPTTQIVNDSRTDVVGNGCAGQKSAKRSSGEQLFDHVFTSVETLVGLPLPVVLLIFATPAER